MIQAHVEQQISVLDCPTLFCA